MNERLNRWMNKWMNTISLLQWQRSKSKRIVTWAGVPEWVSLNFKQFHVQKSLGMLFWVDSSSNVYPCSMLAQAGNLGMYAGWAIFESSQMKYRELAVCGCKEVWKVQWLTIIFLLILKTLEKINFQSYGHKFHDTPGS